MADLKASSLIILLAFFSILITTGATWIVGINEEYPASNINADWNESFAIMGNLSTTTHSIREKFENPEDDVITFSDTADAMLGGTVEGIKNVIRSLGLISPMITDFREESEIPIPTWVAPFVLLVVTISLIFTVASAMLKRGI